MSASLRRRGLLAVLVTGLVLAIAVVGLRRVGRRLAAERVAEALVDAVPSAGRAACATGSPVRVRPSTTLQFDFLDESGDPLTGLAAPSELRVAARQGLRSAAVAEPDGAHLLAAVHEGPCAYALITWRYRPGAAAMAPALPWAVAVGLVALLGALAAAFVAAPLARQLDELRHGVKSLARPPGAARFRPALLVDDAEDVLAALEAADAQIAAGAAQQASKSAALEELLGELAHDVRTPLASLQLALDEIAETAPPDALPPLRRALRDVVYLRSLTSNLRLAERLSPGGLGLTLAPLPLGPVLAAALERAAPFALRRGISLTAEGIDDAGTVLGDATATEQALTNLLDNGIAFGEPGVTVAVTVTRGAAGVIVAVEDDGVGVPDEELPHLTLPAYQGANRRSRPRDSKGSGLGLSIVDAVCARSGWTLRLLRPAGGGFRVELAMPTEP